MYSFFLLQRQMFRECRVLCTICSITAPNDKGIYGPMYNLFYYSTKRLGNLGSYIQFVLLQRQMFRESRVQSTICSITASNVQGMQGPTYNLFYYCAKFRESRVLSMIFLLQHQMFRECMVLCTICSITASNGQGIQGPIYDLFYYSSKCLGNLGSTYDFFYYSTKCF